jgi:hypothetical protein
VDHPPARLNFGKTAVARMAAAAFVQPHELIERRTGKIVLDAKHI